MFPFRTIHPPNNIVDLFPDFVLPMPVPERISHPNSQPNIPLNTTNITPKPILPMTNVLEIDIATLLPSLAPQNPLPNLHSTLPTRRSTRSTRPPSYLQQYVCHHVVTYPIANHLSYQELTPSYHAFINQVFSFYEPQFYHQASKFPEWELAMKEELTAMEANNTWSLVPLPHGKHTIGCS